MAILDTLPGLEVSVLVDSKSLHEYSDEEEATRLESLPEGVKTVPVFIEAASDKEFIIKISVDTSFPLDCPALVSHIVIDGKVVRKSIFSAANFPDHISNNKVTSKLARNIDGAFFALQGHNADQLLKKFQFLPLITSDRGFPDDSDMKQAGEIIVHFFRGSTPIQKSPEESKPLGDGIQMPDSQIHEKALKGEAKSHTTSFGDTHEIHTKSYHKVTLLSEHPIAAFKFKYRSLEALRSLLIISTPSPEPQHAHRSPNSIAKTPPPRAVIPDLDNLSAEDRRRIIELLRADRDKSNSNLRKQDVEHEHNIKAVPIIKKEPKVKAEIKTENLGGMSRNNAFIDLTDAEVPAPIKREGGRGSLSARVDEATPSPRRRAIKREHSSAGFINGQGKKRKS